MEQKLKDYTKGKTHYTPVMNIIMNNRYISDTIIVVQVLKLKYQVNSTMMETFLMKMRENVLSH